MWTMHDGWGWWMLFGWLWFALLWGSIIWLIVWGVSWLGRGSEGNQRSTALEIAKERLARGEISEEEFQRLRKHLA